MINDYGLKSFHFVIESGEVNFEVEKGGSVEIEIPISTKFDVVGMPYVDVNKKVDFEVVRFSKKGFVVKLTNNTSRKKKGKITYEVRGLRVWT